MNAAVWQYWLVLGACLAISFFLAGFEAGVFALNRLRIRHQVRQGQVSARRLLKYLEMPENFLWTIFVGSSLAHLVAVTLIVVALREHLGEWPWAFWGLFLLVGILVYLGTELLPKTLFRKYPHALCLALVRPFGVVHLALSPVVAMVELFTRQLLAWTGGRSLTGRLFASRDELRLLMHEAGQNLSSTERKLINRVLDLQNLTVGQIARPLAEAVSIEASAPASRVLELCRKHSVARLPVWSGTGPGRKILGIVLLTSLLRQERLAPAATVAEYLRPTLYLDESLRLEEALRRLQRSGHHFAIVLGADRKERALVTLWDILFKVFGEGAA